MEIILSHVNIPEEVADEEGGADGDEHDRQVDLPAGVGWEVRVGPRPVDPDAPERWRAVRKG